MTHPFVQLQSRKGNPAETRVLQQPALADLEVGEVLLHINCFAFTANNVTYAMFGEAMQYWQFFPTGDADWGMIPVWGFATVAASRVDGLAVGERFYGYLPTATHLIVQPQRVGTSGFVDGAAHRASLPAVYNQYLRCSADPGYNVARESEQMI